MMARPLKTFLYIILCLLANHHVYYLQTGSFNGAFEIIALLIFSAVFYHVSLEGHQAIYIYVMDPFYLQRVIKLYRKYKAVRITQKEHLLIWNSETTQNLNIYVHNYQTETASYFSSYYKASRKSIKKQLWHAVI